MSDCLFCKMASREVEASFLLEDDLTFVLRDINPRAPVHLLVIPKEHIPTARDVSAAQGDVLARMFVMANKAADREGIGVDGYRLAFNVGENAGMTIPHLHLHVLGGRRLGPEG